MSSSTHSSLLAAWRNAHGRHNVVIEIHKHVNIIDSAFVANIIDRPCDRTVSETVSNQQTTTQVVSNQRRVFLLTAANEGLVGIQYPTFPKGGHRGVPFRSPDLSHETKRFNWCRSPLVTGTTRDITLAAGDQLSKRAVVNPSDGSIGNVSEKLIYAHECIDGQVHHAAGEELADHLIDQNSVLFDFSPPSTKCYPIRCMPGGVVWSPSFGALKATFPDGILHCVPPFFGYDYGDFFMQSRRGIQSAVHQSSETLLRHCYIKAIRSIFSRVQHGPASLASAVGVDNRAGDNGASDTVNQVGPVELTILSPFLGTGVRGWELPTASRLAGLATGEIFPAGLATDEAHSNSLLSSIDCDSNASSSSDCGSTLEPDSSTRAQYTNSLNSAQDTSLLNTVNVQNVNGEENSIRMIFVTNRSENDAFTLVQGFTEGLGMHKKSGLVRDF